MAKILCSDLTFVLTNINHSCMFMLHFQSLYWLYFSCWRQLLLCHPRGQMEVVQPTHLESQSTDGHALAVLRSGILLIIL